MSAGDGSTTGQRTHRYLRLALVVAVAALLTGVATQVVARGWPPLPSLSHYFYTPAGSVFTACLVAVALALLALSGRDLETTFLNIAAVFAPLIAIIPTGYDAAVARPGVACPAAAPCVPAEFLPAVRTGVAVYICVVALVVVLSLVVRRVQRQPLAGTLVVSIIACVVAVVVGLFAFVPPVDAGFPFNDVLPLDLHYALTIAFFAAFAVVPLINAWPRPPEPGEAPVRPWQRAVFIATPVVLAVDLALLVGLAPIHPGIVFWGELVALLAFALFWIVQTVQRWDETDPRSIH